MGSGNTVAIWTDPWVPKLPSFRVLDRGNINEEGPKMVCELIEDGVWKDDLLTQLFSQWEIAAIKSIVLPRSACLDQ